MLVMHEVHQVKGTEAYAYEARYRQEWPRLVGKDAGARLLWYFNLAHGASVSYNVVTLTAFTDWIAWERFARRVQTGDLHGWTHAADALRYGVRGTMLLPLPWSPLRTIELSTLPLEQSGQAVQLFIEDTISPDRGSIDECVDAVRRLYPAEPASAGQKPL